MILISRDAFRLLKIVVKNFKAGLVKWFQYDP